MLGTRLAQEANTWSSPLLANDHATGLGLAGPVGAESSDTLGSAFNAAEDNKTTTAISASSFSGTL